MLAIKAHQPFSQSGWWFEPKWDGYRAIISVGRDFHIFSRRGQDLAVWYPSLKAIQPQLPDPIVLDAELVGWTNGKPRFAALQQRRAERYALIVFDCLYARGRWLVQDSLQKRRDELHRQVRPSGVLVIADGVASRGEYLLAAVEEAGLEGVMAKRLDSPYLPGRRSAAWQKFLLWQTAWVWVTAFVPTVDGVWYWRIEEQQREILKPIGKIRAPRSWTPSNGFGSEQILEKPFLVEVAFRDRTQEGRLRHAQLRRWPTVRENGRDSDSPSRPDSLSPIGD